MASLRSLVSYFEDNIGEHNRVATCVRLKTVNEDEYVYEVTRTGDLPSIRVCLSDAYEYGSDSYAVRPSLIRSGDFILVGSFGPGADSSVIEQARRDHIAVGGWSKLFGALNFHEPWKYRTPQEKESR